MRNLIDEIETELLSEKIIRSLKFYLPVLGIMLIVIIALASSYFWYSSYKKNSVYEEGGHYIVAISKMRAENITEGLKRFDKLSKGNSNYAALAKLNLISHAIFHQNISKAQELLTEIIDNKNYDLKIRNLATLFKIEIDYEASFESKSNTIVKLQKYINLDTEFKLSAQEFLITLYIDYDNNKALDLINTLLTNSLTPPSMTKRIEQYEALVQ